MSESFTGKAGIRIFATENNNLLWKKEKIAIESSDQPEMNNIAAQEAKEWNFNHICP